MKKLLIFLLAFCASLAGGRMAVASNRFIGWVWDSVRGYRLVYDLGSNYGNYGAVPDHTVFFNGFPYTNTICLWTGYYNWHGAQVTLCPGFSTAYMYQSGKANVADLSGNCWKWTCNSGVMLSGGRCILNEAACHAEGMIWSNNTCVQGSWCGGWTGYNSSIHALLSSGGCWQWRCKAGGFPSGSNRGQCSNGSPLNVADQPSARAGYYVNNGATGDGVLNKCGADQYVTKNANGVYSCTALMVKPTMAFDECWKCMSKDDLIRCIASGPSAAPSCSRK